MTIRNSYLSPAKLNLFFRVLYKRNDGFHEIASLLQAVDLYDRLFISPSSYDVITCTDPLIPLDETNYVVQALKLFRSRYSIGKMKIHLEKKIPVRAGLGGGSSNAATTLWALNEVLERPASLQELMDMGSKIGSDVPFFFSLGTAHCFGKGDIVRPFTLPECLSGYLAKPHFGLSTPLVYAHLATDFLLARNSQKTSNDYPNFYNDLEGAAFNLEPRLRELSCTLKEEFKQVMMTGSGTTFFCLDGDPPKIPGVSFFPFKTIQRDSKENWYSSKNLGESVY